MDLSSVFFAAVGIGLLIFLHELGHFAAARAAGVRVEVFSLGFGPRLFGRNISGTDFRVSLVPFGGYVMVAGQDPSDDRYPAAQSLWSKSIGQRALFWSGGVVMNVLFALIVFPLVFKAGVSFNAPVVGAVSMGSAAWEARIEPGDRIVALGTKDIYAFENLSIEVALHGPRPLDVTLRSADGAERVVTATPRYSDEDGLSVLGISPAEDPALPELRIDSGGGAQQAGLRTGDVLQRIAGHPATGDTLRDGLRALLDANGEPVELAVLREGKPLAVQVRGKASPKESALLIGVVPQARKVIGIRKGSALVERLGLRRGDVILGIDGRPFLGVDLNELANGPAQCRVLVLRDNVRVALEQPATPAERAAAVQHLALGADESLRLAPQPGSPAAAAGLLAGDRVVRVDDRNITTWDELKDSVQGSTGAPLRLRVQRPSTEVSSHDWRQRAGDLADDNGVELTITPVRRPVFDYGFVPQLNYLREEVRATDFGDALKLGTVCSLDLIKQLYVTLKRLVTGDVGAKNLGGIIRISQVSYHAAQRGPSWFWYFLALLSLNLAFVNLLPIPVLDGGHLLFLLIERIKGSPVSSRVLGYSQVLGLVFVLLLVLFVTYNDILRLL